MHKAKPTHRRWSILTLLALPILLLIAVFLSGATPAPRTAMPASIVVNGQVLTADAAVEVNLTELAQHASLAPAPPVRVKLFPELEEPAEPVSPTSSATVRPFAPEPTRTFAPQIASPSPSVNYDGLDDIPMVDSSYIIIPPDVNGAVGPTKVMEDLNNNLRIRDKATGVTQLTVGNATFWAPVTTVADRGALTDPRTVYDPYNCCFIMATQTFGLNGSVLVAVSQTSDPAGAWWLYKFSGLSGSAGGAYQLDYPILGFNKNWATVTINRYTSAGAFSYGIALVLNYPQLRVGAGSGTLFTLSGGAATTHFCASPAVTYSATEDTEFVV